MLHILAIYVLWLIYLSVRISIYRSIAVNYLLSKVKHTLIVYPFTEISIFRDPIVHHQLWLFSSFID